MTKREVVFPADRHALYEAHGYSAAIRSGDLLFVSGQVGSREDGTPEPDFQRQVERAFDNLQATLKAAGCGFDDIVDVTSFHTDPENQFETIMAVKNRILPQAALSQLDRGRRHLARRLRLRDQGHRPHPWRGVAARTRCRRTLEEFAFCANTTASSLLTGYSR